MDKYPDYKFIASQAQQYEWLKEKYEPLWERLLEKASLGQFVPTGGVCRRVDSITLCSLVYVGLGRDGYQYSKWWIAF